MKKYFLPVIAVALFSATASAQEYLDDIMFQSFGWDEYTQPRVVTEEGLYEYYNTRTGLLKANGFDMIWLPPPSASTGGVGYFPTELFNFKSTSWGTEAQLKKMLEHMNALGLNPIADVVANHRSGTTGWTDFTNPTWGCDAIVINDEATQAYDAGNPDVSCRPSGAPDTGESFDGSRDIDHTNPNVRKDYKEFLSRLKNLGFKGWRWDVAKGFSPSYFGEYIGDSQPYYSVGEYWSGNRTELKNWIDQTYNGGANVSGTFDFSLYYTLSAIIQENPTNNYSTLNASGNMAGLAGEYGYADKAVTFVDNHDTFVHNSGFRRNNIMMAYAYILTHPGIPCVFAPHYYGGTYSKDGVSVNYGEGYAEAINKLTAIRKKTGVNAFSQVVIDQARAGLYGAYIKKNSTDTDPVIAVKIGPYSWTPAGSGWTIATSGTNYTVWTKTPVNTPPSLSIIPVKNNYSVSESASVTLNATDDSGLTPTIRYTLDGTEPTESSPVYSAPIAIRSNATLKAAAFDNEGLSSGTLVKNFNFTNAINIRFNPTGSGWSQPYIHYWGAQPSGTIADAQWSNPVAMTPDTQNPGWFIYSFPGASSINFLFRNGSSSGIVGETQTKDLTNVTQDSWYTWDASSSSFVSLSTQDVAASGTNALTLRVVQNPATNGEITLKYTNAQKGSLSVFNTAGQRVGIFRLKADSGQETIKTQGLPAGLYILTLQSESGSVSTKVILK
ncbi:chitobiase/beta-hexosaminidase C-terminal domain-containing protein [Bergeyella sp. RCAD1439]|uniref:chitobiase/beta-hexosaminidase C-terminal domain-containing protein n=1 Tax=Bergeyella anatis TaxID=3113737 RepID=UPI002E1996B3|nr:alpha-amylase family glycosyl hydrolase [Bergeyella sp. RCAD1439]